MATDYVSFFITGDYALRVHENIMSPVAVKPVRSYRAISDESKVLCDFVAAVNRLVNRMQESTKDYDWQRCDELQKCRDLSLKVTIIADRLEREEDDGK